MEISTTKARGGQSVMSASRRINGIAAFAAAAAPATAVFSGLRVVDPAAPKSLSDQRRGGRSGPSAVDAFCVRSRASLAVVPLSRSREKEQISTQIWDGSQRA